MIPPVVSQSPDAFLDNDLEAILERNLYRKVRTVERTSAVKALINGQAVCLFCGNDYLGLSFHPRVIQALKEAAGRYGTGAGAARLTSGNSTIHEKLEQKLAALKNKEKALVFSAGYMANLGILTALAQTEDLIVMDKLCHASMVDAARLSGASVRIYPHKNYHRCEEILKKNATYRRRILVTESVFSMDGDTADIPELIRLKGKYGCLLVVDDAHGTGVLGLHGGGAAEDPEQSGHIDIVMGTLSKALGCLGGFAAGSAKMIDYLINFSRPFIFTTALPPALCSAALEALDVLKTESGIFEALWQNVRQMRTGLSEAKFSYGESESPIFPVILGDEKASVELSETLLIKGFLVPAIRYPTVPKGKARLRLTVSAAHKPDDIDRFLAVLKTLPQ
jgi:glycine C-acetyltransferase/8-amino-7-oxononanoate synthase